VSSFYRVLWMTGRNRDSETSEGFTLLEVLIAMAIMTVGISSAILLFAGAASLQSQSALTYRLADFAVTLLSELETQLKSGADLSKVAVKDASHPDFPLFKYSITLIPLDDFEEELFVCVDIWWLYRGIKRNHRFTTVLLRRVGVETLRPQLSPR